MAALQRWLRLGSWICLLACSLVMGASDSASDLKTGITELDMIFPRNETYAPSIVFPVVFAFQAPAVARSMNPSLNFNVWKQNGSDWDGIDSGRVNIDRLANASDNEPFFAYHGFGEIFDVEGTWYISWSLLWLNCFEQDGSVQSQGNSTFGRVHFTTAKGGSQPDLVAATEEGVCSESEGHTFNVTDIVEAPYNPAALFPVESCAVFSLATPTAEPCAAKVDSATAESIAASATYTVCHWLDPPQSLDCPEEQGNGESVGENLKVAGVACLATFVGMIGYLLV